MLADALSALWIRVIRARVSTLLSRDLLLQYYRKLLNLAVEDFLAFRQRTNLFQRVMDVMFMTPQFTEVITQSGQGLLFVAVAGALIGMRSLSVLAILVIGAGVLFVYTFTQARELRDLQQEFLAINYPLVGKMTEIIDGLLTIKALAASIRVTRDITELIDRRTDAECRVYSTELGSEQVGRVMRAATLVFAIGTSIVQMMNNHLEWVDVITLYVLSELFLRPIGELATLYQTLSKLSVNINNFYEVLELPNEQQVLSASVMRDRVPSARTGASIGSHLIVPELVGVGEPAMHAGGDSTSSRLLAHSFAGNNHHGHAVDAPSRANGAHTGHIVFEHVSFAYRGGPTILSDIDLEVMPGERICLIGPSGVGKTTMIRLLLRFIQPREGRILVDGFDISTAADPNAYRRQFGVVSQNDVLFGIPLRENLSYGLDQCPNDDRLAHVLQLVNLWDDIKRLPAGLGTTYADDLFSGGQRQRLFIARALLRDLSVVLLDEPTSAVDFEGEQQIFRALEQLAGGKTTITIAHRLTTVRTADRVVVLRDGRLAACGPHDILYVTDPYYRTLCDYNSFML
jgi:ABC-type bacteriocin/lantibiotic exporter with double-glycine peptidase domain